MWPVLTDVLWSLYLLVTTLNCAKTTEPIEMAFGVWTQVGPRNQLLGGGQIPPGKGAIVEDAVQLFVTVL